MKIYIVTELTGGDSYDREEKILGVFSNESTAETIADEFPWTGINCPKWRVSEEFELNES